MHWNYDWGMGAGFGWLLMVIFWILIVLGAVYLIKFIVGRAKRMEREDSPLDILKKKYAKGEISKEEFEEKKKDII
ncbi:MAG: hypothetical protein A2Z09_01120 [Nitrospirae bacterium RBG_16_43_8]|nr:MAG: hypothetical protein A2Z09_01120 [Nitrospirae bacterium RBG_16_43_8]